MLSLRTRIIRNQVNYWLTLLRQFKTRAYKRLQESKKAKRSLGKQALQ